MTTPKTKPSSVAKIVRNILQKCTMTAPVTIHPEGASVWETEDIADTSVEIGGRTAIIPGYDGQFQAVKIVNGEYKDLGFTSKKPEKVAKRAIGAYIELCLNSCQIDEGE